MKKHETEEYENSFHDSLSTFITSNYGSQEERQQNLRALINIAFRKKNLLFLLECYFLADDFIEERDQILKIIENELFEENSTKNLPITQIMPNRRLYKVLKEKKII